MGLNNIRGRQQPADASEVQLSVDLFDDRATFRVGLGALSLLVMNPSWDEAEPITRIASAGILAVSSSTGAQVDKQSVTLAMHVKPKVRSIREITSSFVRVEDSMLGGTIRAYGLAVYCDDSSWVVDSSVIYPESLFIKLDRNFSSQTSFDDLATALKRDEGAVLQLLGLRLD